MGIHYRCICDRCCGGCINMNEKLLTNIFTLLIVITIVSAMYVYGAPELGEDKITIANIPYYDDRDAGDDPIILNLTLKPSGGRTDSITELMESIKKEDIADKGSYTYSPDSVDDVHVCMNMAVDQAVWINETYGYETGIVMLRYKYIGDYHARTWVIINGTMYIIESTSHQYWQVDNHESVWGDDYKIEFVSVKKGLEFEKENNEWLNNKDI